MSKKWESIFQFLMTQVTATVRFFWLPWWIAGQELIVKKRPIGGSPAGLF
jgi:hypothetical protein